MKRVFSIALALLMLISNVGFSMNTHFCGGEAVKTSFTIGLSNPDCGMDNMDQPCENDPLHEEQIKAKPCCENHHQLLQLDENADIPTTAASVSPVFLLAFVHVFVQPIFYAGQNLVQYTDYAPPLPEKDVQVLFQTFLI